MSFEKFNFDQKIVAGIKECGYQKPTPIQEQAIPDVIKGLLNIRPTMAEGKSDGKTEKRLKKKIKEQGW